MKTLIAILCLLPLTLFAQSGKPISKDQIKDRSMGIDGLKNGYQTSVDGWIIKNGDTLNVGKGSLPNKDFAFIYENPAAFGATMTSDYRVIRKYMVSEYSGRRVIIKDIGISGTKRVGFGVYCIIGVGNLTRYYVELDNAIEAGEILPPPQFRKASAQASAAPVSVADELIKLKQLMDAGALTPEEYNAQKKKLLNQ